MAMLNIERRVMRQFALSNMLAAFTLCGPAVAAVAVGAAPQGNAVEVAARIIKSNFPDCKRVIKATRQADGSIRATCDNKQYLVFTMYSSSKGKMLELALNCDAAKQLGIQC
jgi:hypothetical protein